MQYNLTCLFEICKKFNFFKFLSAYNQIVKEHALAEARIKHDCLVLDSKTLKVSLILGGASRDRTDDPLLAKQVLSQLSYGPFCGCVFLFYALLLKTKIAALTDCDTFTATVTENWWVWEDLNFRPHPYQGCALTN